MKKHLFATLCVTSLLTLLPGCGGCCSAERKVETKEVTTEVEVQDTHVTEMPAMDTAVTEVTPAAEEAKLG